MTTREILEGIVPQMEEHLSSLKIGYDVAIPLDNWAAIGGLTRDRMYSGLKHNHPDLFHRYRYALQKRRANIKRAILKVPSPSYKYLTDLSKKFGMTPKELQRTARYYGRRVKSELVIDPKRIARVAKLGMTVRQLAEAAGCKFGSVQSARSMGRLEPFVIFKLAKGPNAKGVECSRMVVSSIRIPK